jgi:hypothetical protein
MSSILVIAFKFNDIFYSISTPEFKDSSNKILLIFYYGRDSKCFPCQDKFNYIYAFKYKKKRVALLMTLIKLYSIKKKLTSDILVLSNPILFVNQYIAKISKCKKILLLEDGLMNYYNFIPSNSSFKKVLQKSFSISNESIFNRITCTYLLKPQNAIFYFGEKVALHLDSNLLEIDFNKIRGKSIFVGQNLYVLDIINIQDYNRLVNYIVDKLNIDFYIPHLFASDKECIKCKKINLLQYSVTLEILAYKYSFKVYSINSSVLYTIKCINNNIETYMIKISPFQQNQFPFLEANCNKIINL